VYPDDLKYTAEHEWLRGHDSSATVRIGITDFAQDALGDIVYVQLPEVGASVTAGEPMGELESTKSVSDLFAPISGTVSARNEDLDGRPELLNTDPYGDGWVVEITPSDPSDFENLLNADDYQATLTTN
jgi:glycine cleavage system H protein